MRATLLQYAQLRESLLMALSAIRGNTLRSLLTLLGIVVGVFSIIAVMTAMGVLRSSIEEGLAGLGANTFRIQKWEVAFNSTPEQRRKWRRRKNITFEQATYVEERLTLASAIGIETWRDDRIVAWRGEKTNPNINLGGSNLDGYVTNDMTIEIGRNITDKEMEDGKRVILLGKTIVDKLFPPSVNPVGEEVRIDGSSYEVVGTFAVKGGALGRDENNFCIIPITTFFQKYGKANRNVQILVKAKSRESFEDCLEEARSALRTVRHVPPGEPDDFGYYSNDSLIEQFNSFTLYVRLGALFISSIALLAAGVGIMNIMLVSVTERTREIGIRKAVGAQKKDILAQFIIEAVILCEIGGLIGVLLGIAAGNGISLLLEWPAVMPWDWAAIGLGVCSLVGIIFGVYPAWKASTLDPIEALRYE